MSPAPTTKSDIADRGLMPGILPRLDLLLELAGHVDGNGDLAHGSSAVYLRMLYEENLKNPPAHQLHFSLWLPIVQWALASFPDRWDAISGSAKSTSTALVSSIRGRQGCVQFGVG
jgi:hypothetical protein